MLRDSQCNNLTFSLSKQILFVCTHPQPNTRCVWNPSPDGERVTRLFREKLYLQSISPHADPRKRRVSFNRFSFLRAVSTATNPCAFCQTQQTGPSADHGAAQQSSAAPGPPEEPVWHLHPTRQAGSVPNGVGICGGLWSDILYSVHSHYSPSLAQTQALNYISCVV